VFTRWIADLQFRGLLWQLPRKVRGWVDQLGLGVLLQGSTVSLDEGKSHLATHDAVDWSRYEVALTDPKPEEGLNTAFLVPVRYDGGRIITETLERDNGILHNPLVAAASSSVSPSVRRYLAMTSRPDAPLPALRSTRIPEDPYEPRAAMVVPQRWPVGH
jgi:hypothetical protein